MFQFLSQWFWLLPPTTIPYLHLVYCELQAFGFWSAMSIIWLPLYQLFPINETMHGDSCQVYRCTASASLTVTHDWLQQLEMGNEMCSIFFDLKKAFDSVRHWLPLHRLEEIATAPYIVQWIQSYLTCHSDRCWWWWAVIFPACYLRSAAGFRSWPLLFIIIILLWDSQPDFHGQSDLILCG